MQKTNLKNNLSIKIPALLIIGGWFLALSGLCGKFLSLIIDLSSDFIQLFSFGILPIIFIIAGLFHMGVFFLRIKKIDTLDLILTILMILSPITSLLILYIIFALTSSPH